MSSIEPLEFNLTNLFTVIPLYCVKRPQINILPSDCIWISVTFPLNPVPASNELSTKPSEFNLIILLHNTVWYPIKVPPTNILPSVCSDKLFISGKNPISL